jgi:hypothetical protein
VPFPKETKFQHDGAYIAQESALTVGGEVYFSLADGVKQSGQITKVMGYEVIDSEQEFPLNNGEPVNLFYVEPIGKWLCFSEETQKTLENSSLNSPSEGFHLKKETFKDILPNLQLATLRHK